MFSAQTQEILERYIEDAPPDLACFDADGTLWSGDVAEAFLQLLIRDRILSPEVWGRYERILEADPGEAYAFSVRVMAGMREDDVLAHAEAFFPTHEDKIFPKMLELLRRLVARGHEVFLVSGSPRWVIEAAARRLDLDPKKVIAQAVYVEGGVLTDKDVPPTIYGQGKVLAIQQLLQKPPAFAAGNSWSDAEMLDAATKIRLLVNPTRLNKGEQDLASYGRARGWMIEAFA